MVNIKILDAFLDRSEVVRIYERVAAHGWSYGWIGNSGSRKPSRHWHVDLADNGLGSAESCLPALLARADLAELEMLWSRLATHLPAGHQPTRIYANGHTYGLDGEFHVDCPSGAGEVTSLLYVNPVWNRDWGGATVFISSQQPSGVFVEPRPGRLVMFPGDIPHRACAPTRECFDLRVTLVIKSRQLV